MRYQVDCQLAGRRFEAVAVDGDFGDPIEADPERLHGLDLLLFTGTDRVICDSALAACS